MSDHDYTVYTDGACSGNPGPGGWGFVFVFSGVTSDTTHKGWGSYTETTNNRMELTAAIKALMAIDEDEHGKASVQIHSDSQYVIKGITQWIHGWKARGWRTANKEPVKNRDLWVQLDELVSRFVAVDWVWVKGHAGDKWNEEADRLACLGRDMKAPK